MTEVDTRQRTQGRTECGDRIDVAAATAKAMGHSVRMRILAQLSDGAPRMAHDLATDCELAQSTISEHLGTLRAVGLVRTARDGARIWYSIDRDSMESFVASLTRLT
jgi:DNA-binding transcriptional ArsR family regulator